MYGGDLRGEFGGGISLNCYPAFDLVTENSKTASGKVYSDRIFWKIEFSLITLNLLVTEF